MTSPILWCGGEDLDFSAAISSSISATAGGQQWAPDSTATMFRSGYARFAMSLSSNLNTAMSCFLRSAAFASSTFWSSGRANVATGQAFLQTSTTLVMMRWADVNGIVRLRIRANGSGATPATFFVVEKISAAGVVTQIGSASLNSFLGGTTLAAPDKIDVFINYAVSGSFTVFRNGAQCFTFTGDVTTDSVTSLSYVDYGPLAQCTVSSVTGVASWSELMVSTSDTRNLNLVTQTATGTGNADTWTSGAAARVNGNLATDTNPDYSNTAAQIQEYQVSQAIPSGSFAVISVVQHVRATIGASGPQHIDLMVRTGGTDFTSSDLAPTGAWSLLANNWDLNPNTGVAWQTSELAASSSSFNIGYKSVT